MELIRCDLQHQERVVPYGRGGDRGKAVIKYVNLKRESSFIVSKQRNIRLRTDLNTTCQAFQI